MLGLNRKKQDVRRGKFLSLLKVLDNMSKGTATAGKINPEEESKERREYEIFLQDMPDWWTIAAGTIKDMDFFPPKDLQRFLMPGDKVSETASFQTGQKFQMMTTEEYRTYSVDRFGTIIQE